MTRPIPIKSRSIVSLAAGFALALATGASAQDVGALPSAASPSLGGLASGSASNAAGLLQFCIGNGYLAAKDASSMRDNLTAKAGGADAVQSDTGFRNGASGILNGSDGKDVDITKLGSLESNLTQQACSAILQHASSLL